MSDEDHLTKIASQSEIPQIINYAVVILIKYSSAHAVKIKWNLQIASPRGQRINLLLNDKEKSMLTFKKKEK